MGLIVIVGIYLRPKAAVNAQVCMGISGDVGLQVLLISLLARRLGEKEIRSIKEAF